MLDALIVGAGISGLHTALRLQQAGLDVRVFEASDLVGGRLRSLTPKGADAPLEMGATWIWPIEPRINALVKELGLSTFLHHDQGLMLYDLPEGPQPVPGGDGRAARRIVGGIPSFADGLLERLSPGVVQFGAPVTAITQAEDTALRVELADGSSTLARHVVLALPPALANHSIAFTPNLPDDLSRLAATTPVWMGSIVKTTVHYATPFWRQAGFSGAALSQLGPMQEIHDQCGPDGQPAALFGFSGLTHPGQAAPHPTAVLEQLVRLFGPRAAEPLDVIVQDWTREPLTSPPDVVTLQNYNLFGHPAYARSYLGRRLHFCSCETSGSQGHIEDALNASTRATAALLGGDVRS